MLSFFFSRQLPLCCTAVVHSRTNHMLQPHWSRYLLALYASFDDVTTTSVTCVHAVHNCVLGGRELLPAAANRLSSDLRRHRLTRRLFAQRIVTDEFVTIADMTRLSLLFSRTAEGLVSSSQFHFCYSFELLCGDLPDITPAITVAGVLVRNDSDTSMAIGGRKLPSEIIMTYRAPVSRASSGERRRRVIAGVIAAVAAVKRFSAGHLPL